MCTSLSHQQDYEGVDSGSWYSGGGHGGAYKTGAESSSLQHLVEDLRSQLTRCHKVIRGLQLRVRSLSATSDYASSLERTPRKVPKCQTRSWFFRTNYGIFMLLLFYLLSSQVNWAFETSPAPGGVEEDEGWVSDTQGVRSESKPSKELQELMSRVASLEAQLKNSKLEAKSQADEGKCATWPG